jgi:spore germination protein YaaH
LRLIKYEKRKGKKAYDRMSFFKRTSVSIIIVSLFCTPFLAEAASVKNKINKTTLYRVYQNDKALDEYADLDKAKYYASTLRHSHVEEITSRKWLADNFPRYRIYQNGIPIPAGEFTSLTKAKAFAGSYNHVSIKDLQSPGWIWDNYPKFRLYQGDLTRNTWDFLTLEAAKKEAKRWANAHIIQLDNNRWIWDNLTKQQKRDQRAQSKKYQVYQNTTTMEKWKFSYLEDAIQEALKWSNSSVVTLKPVTGTESNTVVFTNNKNYLVFQQDRLIYSFVSLEKAIQTAKQYKQASVRAGDSTIWSNQASYRVFQNEQLIGEYNLIRDAVNHALPIKDSRILTDLNENIWSSKSSFLLWGWNGSSNLTTIQNQLSTTVGLDIVSPSWFKLADASGAIEDTSSQEGADWLLEQNYVVHPLVSNQFNSSLTTPFLADPKAQKTFIQTLIDRCVELSLTGINVDFENLAGKDRDSFTKFIRSLTAYAHLKGLTVSIDLPRGSVKWNHLSAFDHTLLSEIVDYIIIMSYDQFYSGSTSPGPVAGLDWVAQGIEEFLAYGIPREKLIMGIPFYVREWTLNQDGSMASNKAIYVEDIPTILKGKSFKTTWDAASQLNKLEYVDAGMTHVFWNENETSLQARITIAKKYKLAGVAAWRLGYEPNSFWQTMVREK